MRTRSTSVRLRLKIVGATFRRNRCDPTGPDLGGGAVRALSQDHGRPV